TKIQPETHVIELGLLYLRVMEVQVGLAGQEVMQIVLAAPSIEGPGRTAEDGEPVIGRRAIGLGVSPHIPVRAWVIAVLAAFTEPGMLVGGMADDLVDNDFEPQGMGAF